MNEGLYISHFWSDERKCNVFGVRGFGPIYDRMWEDFTPQQVRRDGEVYKLKPEFRSVRMVSSDMPWSYFTFYEHADEIKFLFKFIEHCHVDRNTPPKNWVRPPDFDGLKWCDRCKVFHEVRDPNADPLEEELAKRMAAEIAQEIDNEILSELMAIIKKSQ